MKSRIGTTGTAILFVIATVVGAAHDEIRVIGTLTRHHDSMIDVKASSGATTSIRLNKETLITRDDQEVEVSALAVGQSLVVDAYGDEGVDLLALEVRIVRAIRAE